MSSWPRRWPHRSAGRARGAPQYRLRRDRPRARLVVLVIAGPGGCGGCCIPAAVPVPTPGGRHDPGRHQDPGWPPVEHSPHSVQLLAASRAPALGATNRSGSSVPAQGLTISTIIEAHSNSRPTVIKTQCYREHSGESYAGAGDGIGGVMNVLGDERDRDAGR
jgi:hypothetical protein